MIGDSFKNIDVEWGPANVDLCKSQLNHMSIVLERVLQITNGKRFTRKHKDTPREMWKLHELHQHLLATNATITTALTQELARIKVTDFDCSTQCLDAFDTKLEKFSEISPVDLHSPMAVSFLMSATHDNSELRSAWATKETICQSQPPPTIPTYVEYFDYLMCHAKQLEASVTDNNTSRKANAAESDYLQPYSPSDAYYDDATDLSSYMIDRGGDVDMIHDVLQCNQAMKQGKPYPAPRTHRESLRQEL